MSIERRDDTAMIPPASVTGRVGKLLLGSIQIYYSILCLQHFAYLTRPSLRSGTWVFVGFALWLFPFAVNLGFRRVQRWGYKPLWLVLAVALALAVFDVLTSGQLWGPWLGRWLLAVTIYTHLHIGACHVLAALTGLPGCEMRVIPYYLTLWRGDAAGSELCICPGMWTPIDRWEARLRASHHES